MKSWFITYQIYDVDSKMSSFWNDVVELSDNFNWADINHIRQLEDTIKEKLYNEHSMNVEIVILFFHCVNNFN